MSPQRQGAADHDVQLHGVLQVHLEVLLQHIETSSASDHQGQSATRYERCTLEKLSQSRRYL